MPERWLPFWVVTIPLVGVMVTVSPLQAQLLDRLGGALGGPGLEQEQVVAVEGQFTAPTDDTPARLFITAKLAPGYHIYSITQAIATPGPKRTKIKLDPSKAYELLDGFRAHPAPERKREEIWGNPNLIIETHHDSVTWYAPIKLNPEVVDPSSLRITGQVYAQACSTGCLMPQDYPFTAVFGKGMEIPVDAGDTAYDTLVHLLLALVAGVSINALPCVLPVIPIILMRLFEQSKQSSGQRLAKGTALCLGIILFFAVFALVSAVINVATGAALNLNDLYRYPGAVVTLFLALILFGLMMLDVVPLLLPSSIAGRQSTGTGLGASLGTGLFVAILSIPCSGPMLGAALGWAQTQERIVGSAAIILMGVGMALPYAIIVAFPVLLSWLPKPGVWMEIFKKSCGFLLFLIAVKLSLAALPKDRLVNVLMYGVIFSFCLWMWGKWVNILTPPARKWSIRGIAVAIAVGSGLWLLPSDALPEGATVDWQHYESARINAARSEGQAVLLKFTADWCSDCRVVERRVYHDAEVVRQLRNKGVLAIKADTTSIDFPATKDFRNVYAEAGAIPVTILLVPDQPPVKLRGIFEKGELLAHLEKLPDVQQPAAASDALEAASEEAAKPR
jgi:cytochrome c biogenesis protein CcdA/thiol-disulfide isomerase/thioredoxin